jgi:hypothetical protein
MKLLIMQCPPFSCYFIPFRSKYYPYSRVLRQHLWEIRDLCTQLKLVVLWYIAQDGAGYVVRGSTVGS